MDSDGQGITALKLHSCGQPGVTDIASKANQLMRLQARRGLLAFAILAVLLSSACAVHADPIVYGEYSDLFYATRTPNWISGFWTGLPVICLSILLESIFIVFLLRKFQGPRHFIFWVLGMHVLTWPMFQSCFISLDMLTRSIYLELAGLIYWNFPSYQSVSALDLGYAEIAIVAIEGGVIYLMCRYLSPKPATRPLAWLGRCMLVSLAGNAVSFLTSVTINVYIKWCHDY